MYQSSAVPASLKQRFSNSLHNAGIGEVLTDPKGRTVEKLSYNNVRIGGMVTTIENYLLSIPVDPEVE